MAEDGKIIYKVVVDKDGAVIEAEDAGRQVGTKLEGAAKSGGGAFKEIMTGAARQIGAAFVQMAGKAVDAVKDMVQSGVEFNAKMEQYQVAFTTLLGDADAAAAAMKQIREDAARTPFDVDSLTKANQALVSAGISADQAREDILALANAIAATGGGSDELSRMAANLQQIQNTGKATAMDIRQFANAGINIYGLLADAMGVTTEEAAEMDVTYEQLTAALKQAAEAGGMYEGALEAQSQTFQGRLSTLKDNLTQLEGVLTADLFGQLSDTALPMVQDWVAELLQAAEEGGIEGALEAAKGILGELVDMFIDGAPDMLDAGLTVIENLIRGLAEGAPDAIPVIVDFIGDILMTLGRHAVLLSEAAVELCLAIIDGFIKTLTGHSAAELWQAFEDWIGEIHDKITGLIDAAKQWGWDLIKGFIEGIKNGWNNLKGALGEFASKVADYIGFSEPKVGPLSNFHTYAPDMMELYAKGIRESKGAVTRELGQLAIDAKESLSIDAVAPDLTTAALARSVSYDMSSSRTSYTGGAQTYYINVSGIDELQEVLDWYGSREVVERMG